MYPLLEVEDLHVSFGAIEAVKGLSFDVGTKETVALVGESGCGKSVTSLAILRLLRSCSLSGSIRFGGRELTTLSEETFRRYRGPCIGALFQDPMTSLNPTMSIGDQIAEGIILHMGKNKREAAEEAIQLLRAVEISEPQLRAKQYPHQLSGGMRQRVMLAIALACRPQLLIADEPTTSLDVMTQDQILKLLKKLQARYGMSLLLITHDFGVVAGLCDRVIVMRHGEAVEEGTPEKIYHNPVHAYTRALVHAVSEPPSDRKAAGAPLVEMREIEKKYGDFSALKKVSLTLYEGETLALVGESGSGKTALAKVLLQIEKQTSGEIFYRNQKHTYLLPKEIQIVFQNPYATLDPKMRVKDILKEPYQIHNLPYTTETLKALLTCVGLTPDFLERYPHAMSGGQRQRVGIARALAVSPKLLILDEPLSALDLATQQQILALLRTLRESQGLTYLFITHDLSLVKALGDRVAVMYQGQIVEVAARNTFFESPQHAYSQALLSAVPSRDPHVEKLRKSDCYAVAKQ